MEVLLLKYGYVLLFLGVAVEGEAFLLAAAFLVHRGLLSLPLVVAVAVAANTLTDQVYYHLARRRGRAWLEKRHGERPIYRRVLALMDRHAPALLVGSRFAYGFRILIPAACGVLGMGLLRFTVLDVLAGGLWAGTVAVVGARGAAAADVVLGQLRQAEKVVALAVLLAPAAWLGLRRIARTVRWRELRASDLHAVVPSVIGFMGVLNLASALWPRSPEVMVAVERWLPLEVMQRSRPLMLFAGLALLQVTRNLSRRKAAAWWVATAALAVSFVSHLGRALDVQHSMVAALLLTYLLVFRGRFRARTDPVSLRRALQIVPALALLVVAYGYLGFARHPASFAWEPGNGPLTEAVRSGLLVTDPGVDPLTPLAARFLGSVQIAGWMARLYLLVLLLRPVVARQRLQADEEAVEALFREHGRRSLSAFAVGDDKHHFLACGGRALVAYAVRGGVAVTCGDPLAAPDDLGAAVREFAEHCRMHGWRPAFYEASEDALAAYRDLGFRAVKMAEEAIVDLPGFSLAGGKRATLRAMVNKMRKAGFTVSRYDRAAAPDPALDAALEEISSEWLAERAIGEMSFSVGRFSLDALDRAHVFVARSAARVEAFCSWRPYAEGEAAVLDLMRRRGDAPSGTMDLLLADALAGLRDLGLREASLANAPLASVEAREGALERGLGLVFEHLRAFYAYKNLFQFKKKFAPRWEGRYLVYPRDADLPAIAYALAGVQGTTSIVKAVIRTVVPRAA